MKSVPCAFGHCDVMDPAEEAIVRRCSVLDPHYKIAAAVQGGDDTDEECDGDDLSDAMVS